MAIEFNTFFGGIKNSVYATAGLNNVFCSIVYTALLLSIIILIILVCIYPCKKNTPPWRLVKVFIYVLIASVVVLALHSSFIKNKYQEAFIEKNADNYIDNIHRYGGSAGIYDNEKIKVTPKFDNNYVIEEEFVEEEPKKNNFEDLLSDLEKRV